MSTTKNAQMQYKILEKCFCDFNKNLTYGELLTEVNKV